MACDCLEKCDQAIQANHPGVRLMRMFMLNGEPSRPGIETEVFEKARGRREISVLPTFCPFCGVRYEEVEL